MKGLVPYLTFGKDCREAMSFYQEALGGELKLMTVGESPAAGQMPKEMHGLVMHADLSGGAFALMASDDLGGEGVKIGNAINLMVNCSSEEEIRAIFAKLARGGKVGSELKVEFWGSLYGDLTDRFGLRWMLNFDMPKA
jgi:PhnB protein